MNAPLWMFIASNLLVFSLGNALTIYAPGIASSDWLTASHLLMLYTIESLLVASGLACIAYSLLKY